jgi:hypothetical protein
MHRIRYLTIVLLMMVSLDALGASGQIVKPGLVRWPLGPCTISRRLGRTETEFACFGHDLARIWPPQAVHAGK